MPITGAALDRKVVPLDRPLARGLAERPDEPALLWRDGAMTWRELDARSSGLAGAYRDIGLEPGDRVASLMPNRPELVAHYLACFRAGLVAMPLNYRYATPQIDHALVVGGARLLVAHRERADDVARSQQAPRLSLGVVWDGVEVVDASLRTLPSPDPPAPALILFTSGSTGPAKGVTHSLESLGGVCASVSDTFGMTAADAFLPAHGLAHIGGIAYTFAALAAGARAIVARTADPREILELLRVRRPTMLSMLPASLAALVAEHGATRADFASLRFCRGGGDAVAPELEDRLATLAGLPLVEGYGMTETGLAASNPLGGPIKRGSVGLPSRGFAISLRGDDGGEVPAGTVGRAFIRSPGLMSCYWDDPAATAEVLRDDWLDSGDLFRADEDGYLWFFGRKKQVIVHDGSNISPVEVEGVLAEHPGVALAGVVGIHDAVHGEIVRAYVVARTGERRPSADELIRFARERVGYRAPEEVVFLDEMPLNATGKVDRAGLKRLAEEHLHPHGLTGEGHAPAAI